MGSTEIQDPTIQDTPQEDSIAAYMEVDFIPLQASFSVYQAIQHLRSHSSPEDNLVESFVVAEDGQLVGKITMHQLLLADPDVPLAELAVTDIPTVSPTDDREVAARLFIKNDDLYSVAVIDNQRRLVGVVDYDEGLDILVNEDQEDMDRIMGVVGDGNALAYQKLSVFSHMKNRIGWLAGLALLGFVSGSILMHYESALDELVILAIYLPMLADTGGNAGGQSASLIIRSLAIGELTLKDSWRILRKEFTIALGLSVILAMIALSRIWLFTPDHHVPDDMTLNTIMLCISLALMIQVITSNVIGAALPLIVSYFGKDPAVVASPAITTIVDISGLLIYFSLASAMLL